MTENELEKLSQFSQISQEEAERKRRIEEAIREKARKDNEAIINRFVNWIIYTAVMAAFLFFFRLPVLMHIGYALILGSFAAQLNAINNSIKK